MVQEELIRAIAAEKKLTHSNVKAVLEALGEKLAELKPGEEIRTSVIGTFSVSHRNARNGWNPKAGKPVEIDAVNVAKFKPAKYIRDAINA